MDRLFRLVVEIRETQNALKISKYITEQQK